MSLTSETETFSLIVTHVVRSIEIYLDQFVDVDIEYVLRSGGDKSIVWRSPMDKLRDVSQQLRSLTKELNAFGFERMLKEYTDRDTILGAPRDSERKDETLQPPQDYRIIDDYLSACAEVDSSFLGCKLEEGDFDDAVIDVENFPPIKLERDPISLYDGRLEKKMSDELVPPAISGAGDRPMKTARKKMTEGAAAIPPSPTAKEGEGKTPQEKRANESGTPASSSGSQPEMTLTLSQPEMITPRSMTSQSEITAPPSSASRAATIVPLSSESHPEMTAPLSSSQPGMAAPPSTASQLEMTAPLSSPFHPAAAAPPPPASQPEMISSSSSVTQSESASGMQSETETASETRSEASATSPRDGQDALLTLAANVEDPSTSILTLTLPNEEDDCDEGDDEGGIDDNGDANGSRKDEDSNEQSRSPLNEDGGNQRERKRSSRIKNPRSGKSTKKDENEDGDDDDARIKRKKCGIGANAAIDIAIRRNVVQCEVVVESAPVEKRTETGKDGARTTDESKRKKSRGKKEKPLATQMPRREWNNRNEWINNMTEARKVQGRRCLFCGVTFDTEEEKENHFERVHVVSEGETLKYYACTLCKRKFETAEKLRAHFRHKHHRENELMLCNLCGKSMSYPNYYFHVKYYHKLVGTFPCDVCSKVFAREYRLQAHRKVHEKNHECGICGRKFFSEDLLQKHVKFKHEKDPESGYACQLCQKRLFSKDSLKSHMERFHDSEDPDIAGRNTKKIIPCPNCRWKFRTEEELMVHVNKIHDPNRKKTLKCDECEGTFFSKYLLSVHHRRVHQGKKDYQCSLCPRKFASFQTQKIHERTHTGERPFKCDLEGCGAAFADSSNLRQHERSHTGNKPYRCDNCGAGFMRKKQMFEHQESSDCIHSSKDALVPQSQCSLRRCVAKKTSNDYIEDAERRSNLGIGD